MSAAFLTDAPTINAEVARFKAKEKTIDKAANAKLRGEFALKEIIVTRIELHVLTVASGFLNREKSPLSPIAKDSA
jgi:hypothetical protein